MTYGKELRAMKTELLCNLSIGRIFLYAVGAKDMACANTYWIKVADCFDEYGHYIGCRCAEILMGSGMILDEEMLDTKLEVVLNDKA